MMFAALFFAVCCCGLLWQMLAARGQVKRLRMEVAEQKRWRRLFEHETEELAAEVRAERKHSRRLLFEPEYRQRHDKEVVDQVFAAFLFRRAARLEQEAKAEAAALHERRMDEDPEYAEAWEEAERQRKKAELAKRAEIEKRQAEEAERRRRADEAAMYSMMLFSGGADSGGGDSGCGDGGACGDGGGGGD